MPKPHKDEKKSSYISRCVREVMKEGKSQEQALGQCYGMWRQHEKDNKKKSRSEEILDQMVEGLNDAKEKESPTP